MKLLTTLRQGSWQTGLVAILIGLQLNGLAPIARADDQSTQDLARISDMISGRTPSEILLDLSPSSDNQFTSIYKTALGRLRDVKPGDEAAWRKVMRRTGVDDAYSHVLFKHLNAGVLKRAEVTPEGIRLPFEGHVFVFSILDPRQHVYAVDGQPIRFADGKRAIDADFSLVEAAVKAALREADQRTSSSWWRRFELIPSAHALFWVAAAVIYVVVSVVALSLALDGGMAASNVERVKSEVTNLANACETNPAGFSAGSQLDATMVMSRTANLPACVDETMKIRAFRSSFGFGSPALTRDTALEICKAQRSLSECAKTAAHNPSSVIGQEFLVKRIIANGGGVPQSTPQPGGQMPAQ